MQGFSLTELLAVIVIISMLTILSLTGLEHLYETHVRHDYLNELADLIDQAKTAALVGNEKASICPSEDKRTCSRSWPNSSILLQVAGAPVTIIAPPPSNDQLDFSGFGHQEALNFYGNRLLDNNGSFLYRSHNGECSKLSISKTGAIRVIDIAC